MRILPTIILILTLTNVLCAQVMFDSLVLLTQEQNDKWIGGLEKEIKAKQLDLIKQRILIDTNIYVRQSYADRIKFDNEKVKGTRTEGNGKPLLVFNGYLAPINNNWTKNKSIINLAELLTDNKITKVSIMKDSQTTAIYGSRAVFGVIIMTTDKKILKKIKEIDLGEY